LTLIFENIIVYDCRREGLVKVNGKIPTLLRLQLARYSGDTGYSTAALMRFAGHADASNVVSITDNEHEDRHSPAGDRNISIDEDSDMESLTTRAPKEYSLRRGQLPATPGNSGSEDDHAGEPEGSISQEVRLASDITGTVLWSIFI
jgi:hypothetical protein